MTNNFETLIGELGGLEMCTLFAKKKKQEKQKGVVYPEFLNGTEQAAVKALSHSSTQGYKQFKAEVLSME